MFMMTSSQIYYKGLGIWLKDVVLAPSPSISRTGRSTAALLFVKIQDGTLLAIANCPEPSFHCLLPPMLLLKKHKSAVPGAKSLQFIKKNPLCAGPYKAETVMGEDAGSCVSASTSPPNRRFRLCSHRIGRVVHAALHSS
jgi:hypothetical protein